MLGKTRPGASVWCSRMAVATQRPSTDYPCPSTTPAVGITAIYSMTHPGLVFLLPVDYIVSGKAPFESEVLITIHFQQLTL